MRQLAIEIWDGRALAAARALADLTIRDLAALAGVDKDTIVRLEGMDVIEVTERRRHGYTSREVWARIVSALAARGVELVPEGTTCGGGARWTRPRIDRV